MKNSVANRLLHFGIGGKILALCLCFCILLPILVGGIAYFVAIDVMNKETKTNLLNQVASTKELTKNFDLLSQNATQNDNILSMLKQQIRDTSVGETGYMYCLLTHLRRRRWTLPFW